MKREIETEQSKPGFLYRNSLSIVFFILMLGSLAGQAITGWHEHNSDLSEHFLPPVSFTAYLATGHFLQATFENWESEFFQMALFVILTIWLRQEGSSESRSMEGDDKEGECVPSKDSPPALKKGGFAAGFYKISLSVSLTVLFVVSFVLHWYGSWKDHVMQKELDHLPHDGFIPFLGSSKFWFESFQNWQSEFLSIFAIVFLSIYLRQKGSAQSKKVNDPHIKTGE